MPARVSVFFRTSRSDSAIPDATSARALGAYLGVAIGDALGASVEFMTPAEIRATHGTHRELVGGGWLQLKPGQVTDDTQMALALGQAILRRGDWDVRAVADQFVAWMRSHPVDIGNTCRRGLRRYLLDGSLAAQPSEDDAGNGAAMRNVPVVLASLGDPERLRQRSREQAEITHANTLSTAATRCLAEITRVLILGHDRSTARLLADRLAHEYPVFRYTPWPGRTSGYIVDTVQTVFDAFFGTDSFESCLIEVVNRGGDADTTGAIAGQLAGACYGADAIPPRWRKRLDPGVQEAIVQQTPALLALARGQALPEFRF